MSVTMQMPLLMLVVVDIQSTVPAEDRYCWTNLDCINSANFNSQQKEKQMNNNRVQMREEW